MSLVARDATGNTSPSQPWQMKIDRTAPTLSASGDLWNFRTIAGDPANVELRNDSYAVTISASDGSDDGNPHLCGLLTLSAFVALNSVPTRSSRSGRRSRRRPS